MCSSRFCDEKGSRAEALKAFGTSSCSGVFQRQFCFQMKKGREQHSNSEELTQEILKEEIHTSSTFLGQIFLVQVRTNTSLLMCCNTLKITSSD